MRIGQAFLFNYFLNKLNKVIAPLFEPLLDVKLVEFRFRASKWSLKNPWFRPNYVLNEHCYQGSRYNFESTDLK